MTESDKLRIQIDLAATIEQWLDEYGEIYQCAELPRMMAVAALAVAEASTQAEAEGREEDQ